MTFGYLLHHTTGTTLEYGSGLSQLTPCFDMAAKESRALILEETELGRWALGRALETAGFKVQAVSSWAEASVYLVREQFSLVLLSASLILGDVGGIVSDLSQDHPEAHLILLADQDAVGELRPMCGPGAHILPKPLDLEKLALVAASRFGAA